MPTTGKFYLFLCHCHANYNKQPSSLSTCHLLPSPSSPPASCPACPAQSVAFPPPIYLFWVWPTPWYATFHMTSRNHPLTTTSTDQYRQWCSLAHQVRWWAPLPHHDIILLPYPANHIVNRPAQQAQQIGMHKRWHTRDAGCYEIALNPYLIFSFYQVTRHITWSTASLTQHCYAMPHGYHMLLHNTSLIIHVEHSGTTYIRIPWNASLHTHVL